MKTTTKKTCQALCAFISFVFCQTSFAQKVNQQDIYDVFNSIKLQHDTSEKFVLESEVDFCRQCITEDNYDTGNPGIIQAISWRDTSFSKADKEFIKKQIRENKNFKWSGQKVQNIEVMNRTTIDSIFYTPTKRDTGRLEFKRRYRDGYYSSSTPLFSVDGSKCIIYISLYCGGLCGNGDIYIYKKDNGKWILQKRIMVWVS